MPSCSVFGCTSGRKGSEKVQVFRYPKDDLMKKKWLNLIGKESVGKDSVVCKKHFQPGYLYQAPGSLYLTLLPNAVPTEFRFGPSPISYKRKIINSETAEDTNFEVKPNVLKNPVKSEFNEHGYCYNNTSDKGNLLKFINSEKGKNFCEIFPLLLSYVKSKEKILQNFVAFSEYMKGIVTLLYVETAMKSY